MTAEEKKERREKIEAAVEARSEKAPKQTFWLSRNRLNGTLADKVDIWLQRPERIEFNNGDVQWLALDAEDAYTAESAHYGRWTIARAHIECGPGIPANERECLKVGGEEPVIYS